MKTIYSALVILCLGITSVSISKELPGDSLYQIGQKWLNQDGKEINLENLQGQPVMFSMVYLTCQYLCPTIISEVRAIEAKLDPEVKEKVKIVLVSFDPERDTPRVMKTFAKKRNLDPKRWLLITNKKESKIRELAAALDFKYQHDGKSDFTHSFIIAVLNKHGQIQARVDNANQDKKQIIETLSRLAKEK